MMNRVDLIGRLVADPELKYTTSGVPVSNFTIAVDRNFKNQQGEYETDFIRVVVWRNQAELVSKSLQKGRLIAIEGRLQVRQYQTDDGQKRSIAEVVADRFHFLDRPKDRGAAPAADEGSAPPPEEPFEEPSEGKTKDDLPF